MPLGDAGHPARSSGGEPVGTGSTGRSTGSRRQSRNVCTTFLRGVIALCISVAVVGVAALPATAASQYRFFQFNTAGNVRYGGDEQAATDIASSIVAFRPHIATINEICRNQATALDSQLTARGYPMQVQHTQTIPAFVTSKGITCHYGNALLSVGEGSQPEPPQTVLLPSAGLEQRALTCVRVTLPLSTRACVTHLTNGQDADRSAVRNEQVQVVASNAYVTGAPAVLAGDMNVTPRGDAFHPDQLDPLYTWLGRGPYVEVEGTRSACDPVRSPCGATLGSVKFDYVFLDRGWSSLSATTASALVSDHRMLKGYASR
jgi:endonuclease/exonuclease/phosphatase family metal-dependent hydrolase